MTPDPRDTGVEAAREMVSDWLGIDHDPPGAWEKLAQAIAAHTAAALGADRMERHEEFVEILERRIVQVADLTARLAAAEMERDALNHRYGVDTLALIAERDALTAAVAQAARVVEAAQRFIDAPVGDPDRDGYDDLQAAVEALTLPPPGGKQ